MPLPTCGARFDLVLFMGVLYHLRHPLLALDLIRAHVAEKLLVCQSLQRGERRIAERGAGLSVRGDAQCFDDPAAPRMQFVEHSFAGDPTNWWIPNAPAWRRCCAAPVSASKPGEARTSISADAVTGMLTPTPHRRRDRPASGEAMRRIHRRGSLVAVAPATGAAEGGGGNSRQPTP